MVEPKSGEPIGSDVARQIFQRKFDMEKRESESSQMLFTVLEACEMLSICRTTLYKEFDSGRLVPIKIGRSTRVASSSLCQYVQSRIDESNSFRAQHPGRYF